MSEYPKFLRATDPIGRRRAGIYLCHCGLEFAWACIRVESGYKIDCGCGQHERRRAAQLGLKSAHPHEYSVWNAVKFRCMNPASKDWPRYGGAGISICAEWAASFAAFLYHIGPRPSLSHSIDRIDNRRGYEPGNVRWATAAMQARNKSRAFKYLIRGVEFSTIKEAADQFGVAESTVHKWVAGYVDLRRGPRVIPPRADARRELRHA